MNPQVLGQALVGRVGLGRENQIGQLVLQATAGHSQAVPAELSRRVTVTQIQTGPEQVGHTTRETNVRIFAGRPAPPSPEWVNAGAAQGTSGRAPRRTRARWDVPRAGPRLRRRTPCRPSGSPPSPPPQAPPGTRPGPAPSARSDTAEAAARSGFVKRRPCAKIEIHV